MPNLIVKWKGKEACRINDTLLDKQDCWDNLELIKLAHRDRLQVEARIKYALSKDEGSQSLKDLTEQWTAIQFKLQQLWGFPEDRRHHRFWDIPGCKCPKMDNDDSYPSGYYVVSETCRLHS